MSKSVARLVRQFEPDHYDLEIELDEEAKRFRGRVRITGRKVGRPSQRLTFHANGLKVTDAVIIKKDKKGEQPTAIKRINLQKTLHEVRLHTETMVYPGEYVVEMDFEAPITRGMTGIYPCFFKDGDEEKKLFATQFESHHAREAFPCIDEPEAKATFALTLITRDGIQVLSNTPIAEQSAVKSRPSKDGKKIETRFEKTPRMSTYLLAFVIGELQKKTAKTKSGVEVNTWATVAQPADSLDFALDVAVKSIEYFEDYFGVPYPLPKADHVALPDFSSGAMENWGLITYRERLLLAYAGETGQSVRESIALVIAHETSHQWFGNLVTMRWWNDLWLNESFANMMEYACVDALYPEWHVWNTFVSAEALSAFRRDAIAGVQSVRTDVHHPDEISSLFDPSIVYAKGGRLLWMLKNYLGDEAFRTGLSAYFKKHAYGNTTGDDLWAALSDASSQDVSAFMTPWLTRSGFPLLTVTQEDSLVTISQQHYLDDPSKADIERQWPIPLFANQPELPALMSTETIRRNMPEQRLTVLNGGGYGHYLVRYATESQRKQLHAMVASQSIDKADRLLLLNSASMFARAGYDTFESTLQLLDAYRSESSEPVWDIMALVAGEARRFVDLDPSLEQPLKTFTASLVAAQLDRLGWEEKPGEPAGDTKLRALVLSLAAYAEVPAVISEATKRFAAFRGKDAALPAELRSLIMAVPIKQHDTSAFDYLLGLHDSTNNSDLQNDIADALTATRQPADAELLLGRLKDAKLVKPQDADRWLVYLLRNRYTRTTAWQWMVDNWAWLEETYKHDKSYDYLPRYAASCVNTAEYAEKFHALFDDKAAQPLLKRNIELGSEEITTRVTWLQRDLKGVQAFFTTAQ